MSKQLLRSGTSVGALIREAEHAESKSDFRHKMGVAQKEMNESLYWLELLKETDYLTQKEFDSIYRRNNLEGKQALNNYLTFTIFVVDHKKILFLKDSKRLVELVKKVIVDIDINHPTEVGVY